MSKRKHSSESIIRVGIADKSPLIQAALTHLFTEDERFELIKVWAGGESFFKSIDQCYLHATPRCKERRYSSQPVRVNS